MVVGRAENLALLVQRQLPRGIQGKFIVDVQGDAFQLRPVAVFTDTRGRTWACALENVEVGGIEVCCGIPGTFLAQLCALE